MTSRFQVEATPRALRRLRKLPRRAQVQIDTRVRALASDPHPPASAKLTGSENLYRLRVGDYRVIYEIRGDALMIIVVEIGHRREVYRSR